MVYKKKSQGEIFGIALLFVIIIIGFIVYAQFKKLNPNNDANLKIEGKYQILAESTLSSILKMDSGCIVERDKQSIKDLILYCIENNYFSENEPDITCENNNVYPACSRAINLLNYTLYSLFNSSKVIGNIPFKLIIKLPADPKNIINQNLTNFGQFKYKGKFLVEKVTDRNTQISYYRAGYKRVPSGLRSFATAKRNINFELYLYYK